MRIKIELSGRATFHLKEIIADCGFEWNGKTWYGNILSKDIEKMIKVLKDNGILLYHGDSLLGSMGCKLTVRPTSPEGFKGDSKESTALVSEFDSITDRVEKACKGDYLSKEDHLIMTGFYEGYGSWEEVVPILEKRK